MLTRSAVRPRICKRDQHPGANAEQSTRQSGAVAAGSEEASVNVRRRLAPEELTSSSGDRPSGFESHQDHGKAVEQANQSGASMLVSRNNRNESAPSSNSSTASPDNEFARVERHHRGGARGDAGRGFAVVASEVKALARQTARH